MTKTAVGRIEFCPIAKELNERSKFDNALIVGSEIRAALQEQRREIERLTTENTRQWISVDDRMPEVDIPVLVCQQIYGRRIMVWNGLNWRCEEPGDTLPPHHWMTLPSAPVSGSPKT